MANAEEAGEAFRALWSSARRDEDVLQTTQPGDALELFAEPAASPALAAFTTTRCGASGGAGDRVRAPRAPARRASHARGHGRAPDRRGTPHDQRVGSTATSAPRRSTSRPTTSSRRRTACSSARLPAAASLAAWTRSRSGRTAPSRCCRRARASRTRSRSRPRSALGPLAVRFALALRRESLARLREDPRCALTILAAGDVAVTAIGRASVDRRAASAWRVLELAVERDPGPRPRHVRDRRRRAVALDRRRRRARRRRSAQTLLPRPDRLSRRVLRARPPPPPTRRERP